MGIVADSYYMFQWLCFHHIISVIRPIFYPILNLCCCRAVTIGQLIDWLFITKLTSKYFDNRLMCHFSREPKVYEGQHPP